MSITRKKWSISAMAVELDIDRRRVGVAASECTPAGGNGRGATYWLREVVRSLYDREDLNAGEEKALLDRARRLKVELEIAEKEAKLLDADAVKEEWSRLVMNFRARMLALPGNVAPLVAVAGDVVACEAIVKERVYEALTELSEGERSE